MADYICSKCNIKMVLATGYISSFRIEDEPYEEGKKEIVLDEYGNEIENIYVEVYIDVIICPCCSTVKHLSIHSVDDIEKISLDN